MSIRNLLKVGSYYSIKYGFEENESDQITILFDPDMLEEYQELKVSKENIIEDLRTGIKYIDVLGTKFSEGNVCSKEQAAKLNDLLNSGETTIYATLDPFKLEIKGELELMFDVNREQLKEARYERYMDI